VTCEETHSIANAKVDLDKVQELTDVLLNLVLEDTNFGWLNI
jgi:hypothetical protein